MKLRAKVELAIFFGVLPLIGIAGFIGGSFKTLVWSYGGTDCFRYALVREPMQEEWYKVNPNTLIGRATPLADVPKYLDTPGHGEGVPTGAEHPHARNY